MRFLRLLASFALMVSIFYLPAQKPACACSCAVTTPAEHFAYADLVFSGVTAKADQPGTDRVTFTFRVEKVEKGEAGAEVVVTSASNSAACGTNFAIGTRYRIYAREGETGLCSGNVALGASNDPPPAAEPPKPAGDNVATAIGVAVFAFLSAAIAFVLYRRLRRP